MNIYTRALLLSAMTAVGLTQGCSCSDDDYNPPVVVEPPAGTVTTISGVAAKGIVIGGVVNIHPIIDGNLGPRLNVNPVTTNDSGAYSINISDYTGSPIVVRVTTDTSTMMKCDLPDGCDGASFGDTFSFNDSDFNLDAVLPPQPTTGTPIQTNVSVLTDIASEVAFDSLQSNPTDFTTIINNANTSVANRFGVLGSLNTLPIVDLTDTASLVDVSEDHLRYNMLGASITQAVINDGIHTSIGDAVSNFSRAYALGGLTDNALTPSVTSLADILSQVSRTISTIQTRATTAGVQVNTTNLATVVENLTNLAQSQEPTDTGTQGGTTPTTGGNEQAKAEAFVAMLGDIGNSIDMAVLSGDVTVGARSDAFDMQVQAADMATSNELEQVLEATGMAAEAMTMAYDAYDSNMELSSWESEDGVRVTITPTTTTSSETQESTTTVTLTVKQDIAVEVDGVMAMIAVDMMAMEDVDYTESVSSVGAEVDTAMGSMGISGTAMGESVALTVKPGSMVSVDELMTVYKEEAGVETSSLKVTNLKLELMADIAQKVSEAVTDPITFSGKLTVTLDSFMADSTVTNTAGTESGNSSETITKLALALWGKVMNTSGDSATVSFNIAGNGTGIDFSQSWLGDFADAEDMDTESDSKFTAASLMLSFKAELAGVSDAVTASYNLRRSTEAASTMTLKLSYPGVQMQLATTVYENSDAPQKVVITNQDGVVATFVDGDDITGTIFVGAKKVADVLGAVVTYTDGSFGSLDLLD